MTDAARRASAARITAVMPFFGYARQDRKDQPRVPITAKLVANLLVASGVNRVLTMDLHAQQLQGFFDIPVDHLYALPVLIEHIRTHISPKDLVVVSPDVGGVKMASAYSQALGAGLAIVVKRRRTATDVDALHIIGEVEGRTCIIMDDMVDTAGTLCKAASALKQHGARQVVAYCTHPVLSGPAVERVNTSDLDALVVTDTIPLRDDAAASPRIRQLSVAEIMAETIRRISNDDSVSSLFID